MRAGPDNLRRHRRGVDRRKVEEESPRVLMAAADPAIPEPSVISSHEGRLPLAVLVVEHLRIAGVEGDGTRRGIAHRGGILEDGLHARVRIEGLALLDAD